MKIRKKAQQHNVVLNKDYYTQGELNMLLETREICYFDKDFNECYAPLKSWEVEETELRIFTENLEEIKVSLDEYGYYTNVAVGKNGLTYYINL